MSESAQRLMLQINREMCEDKQAIINEFMPGPEDRGPFNRQQEKAIYAYADLSRQGVRWIESDTGERIGFEFFSIDAWCE